MDFRIFVEPQDGASYDEQLAMALAAEAAGFDAFFRSDHFLSMGSTDLPGPTDSWVTLGGLARETRTIRLGTLVSSATFRHPSLLAIQVAQVDAMSGGRVELGLGTGWFAEEHTAYGIPFPDKRFGMLEEQLSVITGLWQTPVGERFDYAGEHYTLVDSPALPKPVQSPVPLIIGGRGPSRTPALAARFASEYNAGFATLAPLAERVARVRRAVEEAGRSAASMTYSIAATTATGPTDAVVASRAAASRGTVDSLRLGGLAGSPTEVVDKIGALQELGFTRLYFQLLDIRDLDQVEFIAAEILPQVR